MKTLIPKINPVLAFLLFSFLIFNACKKEENVKDIHQKDRLIVKNVQELFATLEQLEKMNDVQLKQWEKNQGHNSFRTYSSTWSESYEPSKAEESLLNLPTSYQALLNKDGEFQLGDTVVWYSQGTKYYVAANEPDLLRKIKSNPSLGTRRIGYSVKSIAEFRTPQTETVYLPNFGLDARYQREFMQQSTTQGNGCRKFVHEIVAVEDNWGLFPDPGCGYIHSFYVRLLLRIKMEWKNCSRSKWNPAGESRTVSYNLTKNIQLTGLTTVCTNQPYSVPFTGSQSSGPFTTTSNVDVVLGGYAGNATNYSPVWVVNLSGTIYQYVLGDLPSNAWNHVGNPFF